MRILGIIPARRDSKRLPGKHLLDCAGKPLIEWTIAAADKATSLAEVIISSNDPAILDRYGGYLRRDSLCGPNVSSVDVVRNVLDRIDNHNRFDAVCLLQPTSPLRTSTDIDEAVGLLVTSAWADSVVSYTPAGSQYTLVTNGAIYLARRDVIEGGSMIGQRWLPYLMPAERSVDVDTEAELRLADAILRLALTESPQSVESQ